MKPTRYILRPIVFTAVRWSPTVNHEKVNRHVLAGKPGGKDCEVCGQHERLHGFIELADHSLQRVCPGMMVVDHPNGTTYACDLEDFEKTAVEWTEEREAMLRLLG